MASKALIVGGCPQSYHRLENAAPALQAVLEDLGFEVTVSGILHPDGGDTFTGDYTALTAENLQNYDLLVLHTTGNQRHGADPSAIIKWVESGKSLVGLHNAADSFTDDPAFVTLIGGKFRTHPAPLDIAVEIVDDRHSITQDLHDFTINDELYLFSDFHPENVHLLAQTNSYDDGTGTLPVAWTREQGAGRVFYLSLGHHPQTYRNPDFLTFFENGVEWAMRRR